jgi:hypothetical protein
MEPSDQPVEAGKAGAALEKMRSKRAQQGFVGYAPTTALNWRLIRLF